MLQDILLTDEERALKEEVRDFVKKEVSPELVKKMDRDEITYPREYVQALGARNLLGLRFSAKYGGRGLPWTSDRDKGGPTPRRKKIRHVSAAGSGRVQKIRAKICGHSKGAIQETGSFWRMGKSLFDHESQV